jgi:hypothetical protein
MRFFGFSKTAKPRTICPICNWVITEGEPGCLSCKDFFEVKNGTLLEAEEGKCKNPKVLFT